MQTPTKRVKYSNPQGIDLSTASGLGEEQEQPKKRRKDDISAFMALRPVGGVPARPVPVNVGEDGELPAEEKAYLLSVREKRRKRPSGREGVEVKRRDWRYREIIWGRGSEEGRRELDKVSDRYWDEFGCCWVQN